MSIRPLDVSNMIGNFAVSNEPYRIKKTSIMSKSENDKWSDRYFQLCLTIFQKSSSSNIREAMNRADHMIEFLKERDKDFYTNCENTL